MNKSFEVFFFSDKQYEKLTAEIHFAGQILCQISMDRVPDNMEIEFFHEQYQMESEPKMKFPLGEFISVLEEVKSDLVVSYQP
ncbi:MAG: hypothetical protein AAF530_24530 [Pseudomonadota bacterium]